jgi:hypothetical protein
MNGCGECVVNVSVGECGLMRVSVGETIYQFYEKIGKDSHKKYLEEKF